MEDVALVVFVVSLLATVVVVKATVMAATVVVALLDVVVVAGASVDVVGNATRVSGPAPLAVVFRAVDSTWPGHSAADVFREINFRWTFDDSQSGTWQHSDWPRDTECCSAVASHVFERPGTYDVTVEAWHGGERVGQRRISITVQDPDQVFEVDPSV